MTTTKTKRAKGSPAKAKAPKSKADAAQTTLLPAKGESNGDGTGLTLAQAEASTSEITFADLGLSEPMLASLKRAGYTKPTPIQAQAVPLALKGRDLMGLAQTGTGKTAAFTIPIIERLLGGP